MAVMSALIKVMNRHESVSTAVPIPAARLKALCLLGDPTRTFTIAQIVGEQVARCHGGVLVHAYLKSNLLVPAIPLLTVALYHLS